MKHKFIRSCLIGTIMLGALSITFVPHTSMASERALDERTLALIKVLEAQIVVLKEKLAELQKASATSIEKSSKKVRSSGGGSSRKIALSVPVSFVSATQVQPVANGEVTWKCDFEGSYCGFYEQSKVEPDERRSTFTEIAREGKQSIKLTTRSGDDEVHGSGYWERNDLSLPASSAYCNAGQEEWWAMSVYFPDDYVIPKEGGVVMDFHHSGSGGQANFHFLSQPTGLRMHGFYGDVKNPTEYRVELGPVKRNVWYDLVYHVKWSEGGDGFFTAWINGEEVLSHEGPTLYKGIGCYLKLANYHDPFGESSSIIFDRVIRGTSKEAVALPR